MKSVAIVHVSKAGKDVKYWHAGQLYKVEIKEHRNSVKFSNLRLRMDVCLLEEREKKEVKALLNNRYLVCILDI